MSKYTFEKDLSHHPLHYFALLCLEIVGLWGIFWFNYQPAIQYVVIVYMLAVYIAWGVVHHAKHKDLHAKIIVEYVLFATLLLILFSSLISQS